MRSITSLLTLAAISALQVAGQSIQVNYFSDGGCADYLTSVHPFDNGKCYNYEWNGMNSAGIANSEDNKDVFCNFYAFLNCQGAVDLKGGPPNNCASNYGHGFASMSCGYLD
jgi:hypothetical protein